MMSFWSNLVLRRYTFPSEQGATFLLPAQQTTAIEVPRHVQILSLYRNDTGAIFLSLIFTPSVRTASSLTGSFKHINWRFKARSTPSLIRLACYEWQWTHANWQAKKCPSVSSFGFRWKYCLRLWGECAITVFVIVILVQLTSRVGSAVSV